ncbi:MAG: DinB family protein [Verrucomicrobiota bacterium]
MNERQLLIQSAIETLRQGEALLQELTDELYVRRLPAAYNASIGGHIRHCLDHFRSLLEAGASGDLNYDRRERNTLIENDRFAALNATRELCEGFAQLGEELVDRELAVTCKTSYSASGSQTSPSTIGREIMYSVAHAVHHYALIGIMGAVMGIAMPPGFGVAPSTMKHRELAKA